ncbi:hypothetical protein PVAND_011375 [Polypedilum vanderplanki]|uniref:Ubiquitin-like protease family profile domain-containing protein n=1 Tax=Polypedilum vanderplanki TaxID=319348 RepID=A0A9J6CJ93_POLVA|nr:hypothetical protein PVAND_011375 [Polypedilum vanderplanki]
MEKIILSYQDSCLYESDVALLKTKSSWLNDKIITFYFEYLENEVYKNDEILFLGCETTQAIKMLKDPVEINSIFLDHLNVFRRDFIIFPLNNNNSHWSLLVYSKPENKFFHFDSIRNSNYDVCNDFVKIMIACLKLSKYQVRCEQIQCLQQNDTSACGDFLLCHVDLVCKKITKDKRVSDIDKLSIETVNNKRQELLNIIKKLTNT